MKARLTTEGEAEGITPTVCIYIYARVTHAVDKAKIISPM